ncbi:AAA family ATPase [Roseomonas sp. E05]|uniref:AAA family ATPase n=1 Tax=Roseomonas sp. E05 TaxID=3046310 RepID=UPI0024B93DD1|nr:AAA family ATPase [Roseomonas sp. E05]MDJ0388279.1 AAA family ATPase [Roseomonas sp. E05]
MPSPIANTSASAPSPALPPGGMGGAAALTGDALDLAIKGLAEAVEEEIGDEPFHLGPNPPQARQPTPPPAHRPSRVRLEDPAEAAAYAIVRRLLEADPTLHGRAREQGAVLVVEVPDAEWVVPVAETWRMLIQGTDEVPFDGDDAQDRPYRRISKIEPSWAEFRRDGSDRWHRPEDGNGAVRTMVASGRPVYGFSPAPARCLPSDLLRAATARVTVGPPDPAALAEAATMLTGAAPVTASVPPEVARLVTVGDLWLARLPHQDADDYLRRLAELASQRLSVRPLTLDGLHGMEEATRWGKDVARDLADYAGGALPWRDVDRGAVLVGPTGTGKTTFARALAAQCGVPLVTGSLGQWQGAKDGHLGTTLGAMRGTFEAARKAAPCILLVDEIDSFGNRTTFRHHDRDYSVQVVNAFLEELDGAAARDGVVVLGCCNDASRIDPAILRPGRLERLIGVPLPDQAALAAILRHHLGGDLPGADLSRLALLGLGSTGAEAERWVRGMRRRARHDRREATLADLEAELRGNGSRPAPEVLRRVAIHEAGHAVVAALGRPGALISASVLAQGDRAGRVLWTEPADGQTTVTRAALSTLLREALAGRAAEEELLGEASAGSGGGAESDLATATRLATAAVTALGLDKGGGALVWRGLPDAAGVPALLAARPDVARRVGEMLDAAYAETRSVVRRHGLAICRLADLLVAKETVPGAEIEALVSVSEAAAKDCRPPGAGRRPRRVRP